MWSAILKEAICEIKITRNTPTAQASPLTPGGGASGGGATGAGAPDGGSAPAMA
jgi:hypothetical protein